ncbi:MAG: glyoxalase/bleomycin resistance/extradiol dioxygenase family protein [Chloroflexi bacterium]|nr:glyoxalase/bleomycin resistance/extradiol dioxygenase family protein [Chloroflexota bacterium]
MTEQPDLSAGRRQRIVPALSYDDAPAMIEFLCRAFGFEERFRLDMPDGSVGHCSLIIEGEEITLASAYPEGGLGGPGRLPHLHASVMVYVDDVDAHYAHAAAEGAKVLQEPEDQFFGDRTYRAEDPEGGRWWFHQELEQLTAEEVQAAMDAMETPE